MHREAQTRGCALIRILVALEVAALRAGNGDVERPHLIVTDAIVGDGDPHAAEAIGAPEDVVGLEIAVSDLLDVVIGRHLQK